MISLTNAGVNSHRQLSPEDDTVLLPSSVKEKQEERKRDVNVICFFISYIISESL